MRLVRHFVGEPPRLLDLGCGDGLLARTALLAFPAATAVLVDHSRPMLERARAAMAPFAGRCEIVEGEMGRTLADQVSGPFDLVVSGFAIHHLPAERKRALYGEVYARLVPGGLFVNVEHVASATPALEAAHDDAFIDQIAAVTGRDRAEVAREYHGRPDKADNILDPVEAQVGWLRELGFEHADCYLKWWELAVFGGVRPTGA